MSKETQAITNDMSQLADDARALMAATADVAGEKVGELGHIVGNGFSWFVHIFVVLVWWLVF